MKTLTTLSIASLLSLAAAASPALAVNYSLNWLDHSPTPMNTAVPNNSSYFLPGVGNVQISYNIPSTFVHNRGQNALFAPGSVTSGADTYSWTNHEYFGATSFAPTPPGVASWDITYTFPGVQPAGTIILGVLGLGRTSSNGGGMTTASVLQNGQFLGDFISGGGGGATQYTGGAGTFTMNNSVTGPGGSNPWWNTELGLVKIMDPVSSLTVRFSQLSGDGAGLNIASFVPTPGAAALAGLAGLTLLRRRRD
jgi:MYXO-CTERM domain-containing protein